MYEGSECLACWCRCLVDVPWGSTGVGLEEACKMDGMSMEQHRYTYRKPYLSDALFEFVRFRVIAQSKSRFAF